MQGARTRGGKQGPESRHASPPLATNHARGAPLRFDQLMRTAVTVAQLVHCVTDTSCQWNLEPLELRHSGAGCIVHTGRRATTYANGRDSTYKAEEMFVAVVLKAQFVSESFRDGVGFSPEFGVRIS